jgi:cell fate regulator YaaT (PSP1 superfamily)
LGYENDIYTDLKKDFPKIGLIADTALGMGKVVSIDIFKGKYYVDLKENGIVSVDKEVIK